MQSSMVLKSFPKNKKPKFSKLLHKEMPQHCLKLKTRKSPKLFHAVTMHTNGKFLAVLV